MAKSFNPKYTHNKSNRTNVFGHIGDKHLLGVINDEKNSNKKNCPLCHKDIELYRYKFHINYHLSKVFNWLFLGSYRNACIRELKYLGINYVLNCAIECNDFLPIGINYCHVKLNDLPSSFFGEGYFIYR